jgi:hypothetical protein
MLVEILKAVLSALRSIFRSRAALLAENVVLASKSSSYIVPCQSPAFVPEIGSCSLSLPASSPRCSRRSLSCALKPSSAGTIPFGVCSGGESPDGLRVVRLPTSTTDHDSPAMDGKPALE